MMLRFVRTAVTSLESTALPRCLMSNRKKPRREFRDIKFSTNASVESRRRSYDWANQYALAQSKRRQVLRAPEHAAQLSTESSAMETTWHLNDLIGDLRVLLLTNSFNSMAQRAHLELTDTYNQDVRIELAIDEKQMIDAVERHDPDVILCPFLTKRIPEAIWKDESRVCLVVHPGIHGDRGASSIDWALKESSPEWGVTVLQADEEMDAGDIWSTKNFQVPKGITKSTKYGSLVVDSAMEAIHEAMEKIVSGEKGIPLDYTDRNVKGTLRVNMKLSDRTVDFHQSTYEVARVIRFSDSSPGAPYTFEGNHKVFLYDAHVDNTLPPPGAVPGTITGMRNGAVRIACKDGSVWVTHMKGRGKDTKLPCIKLPATKILPSELIANVRKLPEPNLFLSNEESSNTEEGPWKDMWATVTDSGAAVIHFPFLNGAMSTDQCKRLTAFFKATCARKDVKAVILAGGHSSWSNGINLNTIEASHDPTQESWENINAINDFVKAIFSTEKVTIAALQGNAGAGGAMAALACDYVWAHRNVVLNPHYKSMGLHGSEYWTYFLPKRVGTKMTRELTERCMPVSAKTAEALGMIDSILTPDRGSFLEEAQRRGDALVQNASLLQQLQSNKLKERTEEWYETLEAARSYELRIMRENFCNPEYLRARKNFVHKNKPTSTPLHLALEQYRPHILDARDNHNTMTLSQPSPSSALLMDGSKVARLRLKDLSNKIESLKNKNDAVPNLAVLIVSGNADSERYVRQKAKSAAKVGIDASVHRFEPNTDLEAQLIDRIQSLNQDDSINGVIVQLPLPAEVDKFKVLATISPHKDVDGVAAANLGSIVLGGTRKEFQSFTPCTAKGIMTLLDHYGVSVQGRNVCIIGRSCIVGMPTQLCLMKRGATVTNCDVNTTNLADIVGQADIVVASAGSPQLVKAEWIRPGAVVVDAGFHVLTEESSDKDCKHAERIVGDVEEKARQVASLMTPVPGGVGPMTVSMLLENTVDAFLDQQRRL